MLTSDQWYRFLLKLTQVKGAEEPPNGGPPKEDETEDEDEEEEGDPPKEDKSDISGLTSALQKERADRKKFEKEAKSLRKLKEELDSKDATEGQKATKRAEVAELKATKLAGRLATQAVDMAIIKFANQLGFQDVSDALVQVKRDVEAWIDQDEDDPSEIEVDEKAVERAVKTLAEKKKYLLKPEGADEELPSGSKFGGGKNRGEEMDDATLRGKYTSLRQISTTST